MRDEFCCCYFCQSFFFLLFLLAIAAAKENHLKVVLCLKQFCCSKEDDVSEVGCPSPPLPWAECISEGCVPTSSGISQIHSVSPNFRVVSLHLKFGLTPFCFLPLWSPVTYHITSPIHCPSLALWDWHLLYCNAGPMGKVYMHRAQSCEHVERKKKEEHSHHVCSSQIPSLQKWNICTQCCFLWRDFTQSLFECRWCLIAGLCVSRKKSVLVFWFVFLQYTFFFCEWGRVLSFFLLFLLFESVADLLCVAWGRSLVCTVVVWVGFGSVWNGGWENSPFARLPQMLPFWHQWRRRALASIAEWVGIAVAVFFFIIL